MEWSFLKLAEAGHAVFGDYTGISYTCKPGSAYRNVVMTVFVMVEYILRYMQTFPA